MTTTRICFVLTLVFVFTGCSSPSDETTTNVQTNLQSNSQPKLADESYAVYSALLEREENTPENSRSIGMYVINEDTGIDRATKTPIDQVLRNINLTLPAKYEEAFEDYKLKNKQSQKLTKSFDLKDDYVLINRNEFRAFFKGENLRENWEAFYREYQNSSGFITFSKVGFDAEKKYAFVYVELNCGSLCADASYFLLKKEQGIWKETKRAMAWAS